MLEQHPALHYVMVLMFYHLGLAANMLAAAHLSAQSSTNAVRSIRQYAKLRWVPLFVRWVVCLAMFLIVWENPAIPINLERFMPSLPTHIGVGIGLGWLCDSVWDKVLGILLPGIQKELPAIPTMDGGGQP